MASSSPRLVMALDFMKQVQDLGYTVAPAMPEPEVLLAAARSIGITPKEALTVYLKILNSDDYIPH